MTVRVLQTQSIHRKIEKKKSFISHIPHHGASEQHGAWIYLYIQTH